MHYVSTRGSAPVLDFEGVLLAGLASDGGLYVPERWPTLTHGELAEFRGAGLRRGRLRTKSSLGSPATHWMQSSLRAIVAEAYAGFGHPAVAPLAQLGPNRWLLELFHGPTLAFKDVALQVLGRLYDHVLERRDARITIVGATSGDTGSAAIEAIRGRERASIFILHPAGRVSEVQRRQMTTVDAANVHNIAVDGTFDDCQAMLKAMFNDRAFRDELRLSGVNSINWARIVPQVVYYVTAAVALGAPDVPVSFSVPSGNFGDVFSGFVAQRMGLPVERLVVASNENDILTRALTTGDHRLTEVTPTMSPSMDIQVSSNFERLLFEMHDRDAGHTAGLMRQLAEHRAFRIGDDAAATVQSLFHAGTLHRNGDARDHRRRASGHGHDHRPAHGGRGRGRGAAARRSRDPDGHARDRAPRQVPRCGRARDRRASAVARSACESVRARGTLRVAAERPLGRDGAHPDARRDSTRRISDVSYPMPMTVPIAPRIQSVRAKSRGRRLKAARWLPGLFDFMSRNG